MLNINFIGCGKVGKTLAKLIVKNKIGNIVGIKTNSVESAQAAVNFIGSGVPYQTIDALPLADIYFITTQDDKIKLVAQELIKLKTIKKNAILVHCSGVLTSDDLLLPTKTPYQVASIHPLKSFADCASSVESFKGTLCMIEGDDYASNVLSALFVKLGGKLFPINKTEKKRYHAACVIANNYIITLHYAAYQTFLETGIDSHTAEFATNTLMNQALENIKKLNHSDALTGPIKRADIETIQEHLNVLTHDGFIKNLYQQLGLATLNLTNHNHNTTQLIKLLFSNNE